MNITLQINQANMDAYSDPSMIRPDWKLVNLGNAAVSDEAVAETEPEVLIVDAVTPVTAELIEKLPKLKMIHSQGVAYNRIDTEAAKKRGIYVCNNAGVNAVSVAEHAVMLMLASLRRLCESQESVYAGHQIDFKNRMFSDALPELYGKKVGIVGYGAIGKELAKRLSAFGCELFYYDVVKTADPIAYLPLNELLSSCDIITLHVPVLPSTTGMINEETLKLLKKNAVLLNTARGELVDQEALKKALEEDRIGLFAADTLSPEPVLPDNPLLNLSEKAAKKVLLTPHIAGFTAGSFERTYRNIWKNTAAVQDGLHPDFVVNGL